MQSSLQIQGNKQSKIIYLLNINKEITLEEYKNIVPRERINAFSNNFYGNFLPQKLIKLVKITPICP